MPPTPSTAPLTGSERRYRKRKAQAATGREVLDAAWGWTLAELKTLATVDSTKADTACHDLAEQLEGIARDAIEAVNRAKTRQPLQR